MIPFEQACALKDGDTVYEGKYKVRVVKVKVNKSKKTVAITYTDGGADNFEASNERLSLASPGAPAAVEAAEPGAAEPPGCGEEEGKDSEAFSSPKIPALSKTKTGRAAIELAFERHNAWRSLAPVESDRRKIASAVSSKLGIPLPEFDEPAFNFLTTALAIGKWVARSGHQESEAEDTGGPWEIGVARHKIAAGMLARLFCHPYVQDVGSAPHFESFLSAFAKASDSSLNAGIYVVSASQYVRLATIEMARHLGSGQEGPPPVTNDFFDGHREVLDNIDADGFYPGEAAIDASIQIFASISCVNDHWAGAPDLADLPQDDMHAHEWLRKYLNLSGAFRAPAMLRNDKLVRKGSTLSEAIDSMDSDAPFVLLESVFENPNGVEIVMPFVSDKAGTGYLMRTVSEGVNSWKGGEPKLTLSGYAQL